MKVGWSRFAVPLTILAFAGQSRADSPADDAKKEQARKLFVEGVKAAKKGNNAEACDDFQKAWELQQHFQIAGKVGECELEAKRYRDAAEHLAYASLEPPAQAPPGAREKLDEMLKQAEANVVALTVRAEPLGAEVTVNGKTVGKAPIDHVVYADPGKVVVEVKMDGFATRSKSLEGAAGSAQKLDIILSKAEKEPFSGPAASTGGPAPDVSTPERGHHTNWWPLVIGGGAGLVAMGVGFGMLASSLGRFDDAANLTASTLSGPGKPQCPAAGTAYATACADHDAALADSKSQQNLGIGLVLGGLGAVALSGGVTALLDVVGSDKANKAAAAPSRATVRLVPAAGPGTSGIWAVGKF